MILPHESHSEGVFLKYLHQFVSNSLEVTFPRTLLKMRIERYQGHSYPTRTPLSTCWLPPHVSPPVPISIDNMDLSALCPAMDTSQMTWSTIPKGNLTIGRGGVASKCLFPLFLLIWWISPSVLKILTWFLFQNTSLNSMFQVLPWATSSNVYKVCKIQNSIVFPPSSSLKHRELLLVLEIPLVKYSCCIKTG